MVKIKFKFPKTFLIIIFLTAYCIPLTATVRYVSHEGSNTPPYTSWETAADSIMSAINISVFGDTIYVANGVYEEQVIMIPGLTLVGSGMDSTIIDTRQLAFSGFNSVTLKDSCIFKGFQLIVANQDVGNGIKGEGQYGLITLNNIKDGVNGIYLFQSDIKVEKNICENNRIGIRVSHSSSIVRGNNIYSDYFQDTGIILVDFNISATPIIDSNIITTFFGIDVDFGTNPLIKNNIIYLIDDFARGYSGSLSDSVKIYNNLIIAENGDHIVGIQNTNVPTLTINNYVTGNYEYGIGLGGLNLLENNVTTSGERGFSTAPGNTIVKYNNSWNNEINYYNFTPDSTNLSVDPMIVSEDSLDFHLQMYSPLIDAGDPNILDIDGSRSDIGLWGGPYGGRYTYRDLAPKPPSNLTAVYDSGFVLLRWNRNTEADFSHYRVYRDTVPNFVYDTTKIIAEVADTFYYDDLPEKYLATEYYYKLTAMDSTGHQSATSEEVNVTVTGVPEGPPIVVEQYKLLNNYPNPFNPSTTIPYRLKEGGHVRLTVYNLLAEKVAVLVDEYQDRGYYEVLFNPSVSQRKSGNIGSGVEFSTGYNNDVATGIYIYELIVSDSPWEIKFAGQGKMILLK